MEIKNNPQERALSKEIRRKMIEVDLSVKTFCGMFFSESGVKQYLPTSPTIPLVTYDGDKNRNLGVPENHSDLITVQTLRADSLVVPRKSGHNSSELVPDPDFINIPSNFIKEGSYIVLLVPKYFSSVPEEGVESYDTTILKCESDRKLLKLTSLNEGSFREDWNKFRTDKEKLHAPKELSDNYYELTTINAANGKDPVNIWLGDLDIRKKDYKRIVNGVICYRMVEGKAERKKSKDPERVLKLVPQTVNKI